MLLLLLLLLPVIACSSFLQVPLPIFGPSLYPVTITFTPPLPRRCVRQMTQMLTMTKTIQIPPIQSIPAKQVVKQPINRPTNLPFLRPSVHERNHQFPQSIAFVYTYVYVEQNQQTAHKREAAAS